MTNTKGSKSVNLLAVFMFGSCGVMSIGYLSDLFGIAGTIVAMILLVLILARTTRKPK